MPKFHPSPDDINLLHNLDRYVETNPASRDCVVTIKKSITRGTRLRYVHALTNACKVDRPNQLEIVLLVLQHPSVNPSAKHLCKSPCFWNACHSGSREVIQYLLMNTNIDPSCGDSYPVAWLCKRGFEEELDMVLRDPRVDPCMLAHNQHPLMLALANHQFGCIRRLLQDPRVDVTLEHVQREALACSDLMPEDLRLRFFPEN